MKKLREVDLFSLEKSKLRGTSSLCINTQQEGMKTREPDSSLWCPVTRQEAVGTNQNTGGSF